MIGRIKKKYVYKVFEFWKKLILLFFKKKMYVLKWFFLYVFDKIKLNVIRYLLVICSKFKYLSVYVLIYYGY